MLEIPFWDMVIHVILTVIVPLFLGFGVRHYFNERIEQILPVFPAISVTFIIFICIITASVMVAVWQRTSPDKTRS